MAEPFLVKSTNSNLLIVIATSLNIYIPIGIVKPVNKDCELIVIYPNNSNTDMAKIH